MRGIRNGSPVRPDGAVRERRLRLILIIDLGTQSFRATVLARDGSRYFEYVRPITTQSSGASAEQDPAEWRDALFGALYRLSLESGLAARVQAIAACGTLSGLVCLDRDSLPLGPALLYADRRPAACSAKIEQLREFQRVSADAGWRSYAGDFLPQICFLREAHPERYEAAPLLLDSTGYLNWLLTGEASLDRYTAYTCYADPVTDTLPLGLFRQLGIDPAKLGRPVAVGEAIGRLRPGLATEFGFGNLMVYSVSYDSTAAYLGAGFGRPGEALDISGTVTSFGVISGRRIIDPQRRVFSIPSGDGRWIVRGSTALSGGVLEWARETLIPGDFSNFDCAVLSSPPGANGVLFLPYLAGVRAPLWESAASGVFFGLTPQTTQADIARAVYEGLCYSLRHIISVIESCGADVHSMLLGGGLSRNAVLNQLKADITGKPVLPLEDAELTTMGAASIVARQIGWLEGGEENGSYILARSTHHPQEQSGIYDIQFHRYLALASTLLPVFGASTAMTDPRMASIPIAD